MVGTPAPQLEPVLAVTSREPWRGLLSGESSKYLLQDILNQPDEHRQQEGRRQVTEHPARPGPGGDLLQSGGFKVECRQRFMELVHPGQGIVFKASVEAACDRLAAAPGLLQRRLLPPDP